MESNTGNKKVAVEARTANELAVERNRLAAERTLMAWVRTSLSMISFGFTIYKFMQVFQEQGTLQTILRNPSRNVGLALIGIGTFALIVATIQHFRYLKNLNVDQPYKFWVDLSFIVSCLLMLLGFLMFISIAFNSGPFN
jgi:putative membrane protein